MKVFWMEIKTRACDCISAYLFEDDFCFLLVHFSTFADVVEEVYWVFWTLHDQNERVQTFVPVNQLDDSFVAVDTKNKDLEYCFFFKIASSKFAKIIQFQIDTSGGTSGHFLNFFCVCSDCIIEYDSVTIVVLIGLLIHVKIQILTRVLTLFLRSCLDIL